MEAGPLMQVWQVVQRTRGAVTPAMVAEATGLNLKMVEAALDWLARRGWVQRVQEGAVVCRAGSVAWCRVCAWKGTCPIQPEGDGS